MHLDFQYKEGTSNTCDKVICCRAINGFPSDTNIQSGQYGEYKCDSPIKLLTSMADYINNVVQPDVIIWTGDSVPHSESMGIGFEEKKSYFQWINQFLKSNFTNIPLYPTIGNHDYSKTNFEDFTRQEPLFQYLQTDWSYWLDASAMALFKQKGYYKQVLKLKGGRTFSNIYIIGLNTEVCYFYNFYLFSQRNDPGDLLNWLDITLTDLEANYKIAILIGHIPPNGMDCNNGWSSRYKAITDRFQHIIRFSAYGHSHKEWHNNARAVISAKPIGVQYQTGSITPLKNNNPSFRVYEVDDQYFVPLKVHTYSMDISAANPQWAYDHELKQHYSLTNLSPSSFDDLSVRILNTESLGLKYTQTQSSQALAQLITSCDIICRFLIYCQIRQNTFYDYLSCLGINKSQVIFGQVEFLFDPWFQF
ncbi:saposin b domain-containing protein [Stylonychia lemnae]|uniref:Saposin b domain-containing protein n=1 Tax=Stylonychia lemnae TaxID=5949 RepID=A0A078A4H8_STYLE|nr:saposin b domain-containing protein [Stylonychia lemnae]|eukprot:CDW76799.1 saposin b domain-containing protein [Stylonychia lemnae]